MKRVQIFKSLVQEDPKSHGAAKPPCTTTIEPRATPAEACTHLKPVLHSKRSHAMRGLCAAVKRHIPHN